MTAPRLYELAARADTDLDHILIESGRRFGGEQRARYAALILSAIERIARNPERPGSRSRIEIEDGLRSYAVRLMERRAASPHVIFYR